MMINRFERQEILKGFGREGQQKLQQARILVVGAGGLGCPVLLYLAAAGLGTLGIADGDVISASNLNRQILFGVDDIGQPKATTAARFLTMKYPDVRVNLHQEYLQLLNAVSILENYDLIIDGSDNFPTRYLLNDACVLLKKPYLMAAIYEHEGQLAVLNQQNTIHRPLHYRDLYPLPPNPQDIPNCNTLGVLGVLPGMLGCLLAAEALKIVSGMGSPFSNKLLHFNLLTTSFYEIEITEHPLAETHRPKTIEEFLQTNYILSCGGIETLKWTEAMETYPFDNNTILIDVREHDEIPSSTDLNCLQIPIHQLELQQHKLQNAGTLLLFCQTGIRSQKAAAHLKSIFPNKHIYSILGGVQHADCPLK